MAPKQNNYINSQQHYNIYALTCMFLDIQYKANMHNILISDSHSEFLIRFEVNTKNL